MFCLKFVLIICKFEELGSWSGYKRCVVPPTALRFSLNSILPLKRVGFAKKSLQPGNKLPLQKRRKKSQVHGAHGDGVWFVESEQIQLTLFSLLRRGGSHVSFIFRSNSCTGSEQRRGEFDLRPAFRKNFNPAASSAPPRRSWSVLSRDQRFVQAAWSAGPLSAGEWPPTAVGAALCRVGPFLAHAIPWGAGSGEAKQPLVFQARL